MHTPQPNHKVRNSFLALLLVLLAICVYSIYLLGALHSDEPPTDNGYPIIKIASGAHLGQRLPAATLYSTLASQGGNSALEGQVELRDSDTHTTGSVGLTYVDSAGQLIVLTFTNSADGSTVQIANVGGSVLRDIGSLQVDGELAVGDDTTLGADLTLSSYTPTAVLFVGTDGLVSEDPTHFFYSNTSHVLALTGNLNAELLTVINANATGKCLTGSNTASTAGAIIGTNGGTGPGTVGTNTSTGPGIVGKGNTGDSIQGWNNSSSPTFRADATTGKWTANGVSGPLKNSASLNFADTAAGTSTDLTITVTGAVDGDIVEPPGVPIAAQVANGVYTAFVSAADTVTVRFTNTNLVTAINPAAGTFKVLVYHF